MCRANTPQENDLSFWVGKIMSSFETGRTSSRQIFVTFSIMWLVIVFLTIVVATLIGISTVKADVLIPLKPLVRVSTPAHITDFSSQTSPSRVEAECQSLLSPTIHATGQMDSKNRTVLWDRRNAGKGDAIQAIKSYRNCPRAVSPDEFARN